MKRPTIPTTLIAVTTSLVLLVSSLPNASASADWPRRDNPSIAVYGDRLIDLRVSWEGADACTSDGRRTVCFDTVAEMDGYLATTSPIALDVEVSIGGLLALSVCSSSLRLSTGAGYSGNLLNLSTRFVTLNLSTYGFDNLTSSYRVGACDAVFFENAGGAGATYPGSTSAWTQSPSMVAGWDNRVSSVYIG
jgi:hypothetical protein